MNNIHGARLNRDILEPKGSGFVGHHAPDFLLANDRWSQIVSLKYGPDGSVYMIDWYDKNQCHHRDVNGHDRTNGRIFKVSYGDAGHVPAAPTSKPSRPRDLVEQLSLGQRVARPPRPPDAPGAGPEPRPDDEGRRLVRALERTGLRARRTSASA